MSHDGRRVSPYAILLVAFGDKTKSRKVSYQLIFDCFFDVKQFLKFASSLENPIKPALKYFSNPFV